MFFARTALGVVLLSTTAVAQSYVISTVAGGAPPSTPASGTGSSIAGPYGLAVDGAGNAYFASWTAGVLKLDVNGVITLVAGNGRPGYSGDGSPGTSAQLFMPGGVAADALGNIFIADSVNNRVRKVIPGGVIVTVAGTGAQGYSGDGGPAVSAILNGPNSVAVDAQGNLYIGDSGRVRKVSPAGIISTVAGNGTPGYSGDGAPAINAQLSVNGIALDGLGDLFIADGFSSIRKVSPAGIITTVGGGGIGGYAGDGGPATAARLCAPHAVAPDKQGNLWIADSCNNRIRKISPGGTITTVAGNGTAGDFGDGGPASSAQVSSPESVAVDAQGNVFIGENTTSRIRKISPDGVITTVAGNGTREYSGDGGQATKAVMGPLGVAVDGKGNIFIADGFNHRIRRTSPDGMITTVAGTGTPGYSGDGGPATNAQLNVPSGVAVDGQGNVFISDANNARIRKISSVGIITTVAGTGASGFSGDGGQATSARLSPSAVAVDGRGNIFLADSANNRIRKVSTDGVIVTVAGNGTPGYSGDGGPATAAQLGSPMGVAVDGLGNIFIADTFNNRIRKVSADGTITTATPIPGQPWGVAVDGQGNCLVADYQTSFIWRGPAGGVFRNVAGAGGQPGYSGDGGPATTAQLYQPRGIASDSQGNIYVADTNNGAIRLLQPTNQSVLVGAVVDAANQQVSAVSPGKIAVFYGTGLGPSSLQQNQPVNGVYPSQLFTTTVAFNGIQAPIIYTSARQVASVVPYAVTGTTAQVTVSYQGQMSSPVTVSVSAVAPSLFTLNQTGAGQAAAINAADGSINTAANPVKIGGYISLYGTGEGQTTPAGIDGKVASGPVLPQPNLKVSATVGGVPAVVQYAGAAPGEVAGVMQLNVQIPAGVQPGGYVPVVLQVGGTSTTPGAVWIAVSGN